MLAQGKAQLSVVDTDDSLAEELVAFVAEASFPCLGAKAALNAGAHTIKVYQELASTACSRALAQDLEAFVRAPRPSEYATFIAIFRGPEITSEEQFEELLWSQLRDLHRLDQHDWDSGVSSNPQDPAFSFSFAGQGFYIVGMHPHSSRMARRFSQPALIFNRHEQFERLRHDGKWTRMQASIRERDLELQGSINPMLGDFGESSEARQYSGRAVEEGWRAPFPQAHGEGRCPFGHGS